MSKDNEVDEKVMPVAWQWLDTSNFRKNIPSTAIKEHWNPLYSAATVAELRGQIERAVAYSAHLEDVVATRNLDWYTEKQRADAAERRVGELIEMIEEMREYVSNALHEEREAFKGHEHCSNIPTMEQDLKRIDVILTGAPA